MRIQTEYMTVIRGAPRHVTGAPRLVVGAPSYSEGRQECPPRVRGSVRAVRAVRNTLVFLTETRVVADEAYLNCTYRPQYCATGGN